MYRIVNIEKKIKGEKLEKILIEAAKWVGLRATSIDKERTEYRLGSAIQEQSCKVQVYTGTTIRLKGRVLPVAEISGIKKGEENDFFSIGIRFHTTIPYFGFGSEKQIKKYLSAVSKLLCPQPEPEYIETKY